MTIRVCASVDGDFKLILGNPVLVIILNQAICSVSLALSLSLSVFLQSPFMELLALLQNLVSFLAVSSLTTVSQVKCQ